MTTRFTFASISSANRFYAAVTNDDHNAYYLAAQAGNAVAVICTTSAAVERCQRVFSAIARILGCTSAVVLSQVQTI